MNARIHQGLAWIFVAALAGAAGCSASDGSGQPTAGTSKPAPGTPEPGTPTPGTPAPGKRVPGRERPGGMLAECFGPSALDPAARERLADQVCASGGRRAAANTSVCAAAYQVRSDAQIAGLLSAWNDAVIRESTAAARDDADPIVRDVAHLLVVTQTNARGEQRALIGRLKIQPEATDGSRALGGGYEAECGSTQVGAMTGRDYVARQIEAEHRALQLMDALVPQTRNADLRCSVRTARAVTETQLNHACFAWASMRGDAVGVARSPEEAAGEGDDGDETGDGGEP